MNDNYRLYQGWLEKMQSLNLDLANPLHLDAQYDLKQFEKLLDQVDYQDLSPQQAVELTNLREAFERHTGFLIASGQKTRKSLRPIS